MSAEVRGGQAGSPRGGNDTVPVARGDRVGDSRPALGGEEGRARKPAPLLARRRREARSRRLATDAPRRGTRLAVAAPFPSVGRHKKQERLELGTRLAGGEERRPFVGGGARIRALFRQRRFVASCLSEATLPVRAPEGGKQPPVRKGGWKRRAEGPAGRVQWREGWLSRLGHVFLFVALPQVRLTWRWEEHQGWAVMGTTFLWRRGRQCQKKWGWGSRGQHVGRRLEEDEL